MTNLITEGTLSDILLLAVVSDVACLIALETELLMAIKRVVSVFAAEYTI